MVERRNAGKVFGVSRPYVEMVGCASPLTVAIIAWALTKEPNEPCSQTHTLQFASTQGTGQLAYVCLGLQIASGRPA